MKLKSCASVTSLFRGIGVTDTVKMAKALGFSALEFQLLDDLDLKMYSAIIRDAGLEVALINFGIGDLLSGGNGLSGVPGKEKEFIETLSVTYDNANILDAKIVNIGPSLVPRGMHRDKCTAQLIENLIYALDKFSRTDRLISIEAINSQDWPGILVDSPEMCLDIIHTINCDQLVLQYDIYHSLKDNRDISSDLKNMIKKIGHIQFADNPGRCEPGTGNANFREYFNLLRQLKYSHYIGAEYTPSKHIEASFDWLELL